MKKISLIAAVSLLALAVPAQAHKKTPPPPHKPKPAKPHPAPHKPKPAKPHPAAPCRTHFVDYHAKGVVVAASLTPTGHGRYSGSLQVNVTKANHHAPLGTETLTLTNAKVKLHHHQSAASLAGHRVNLVGKLSKTTGSCPTAPTMTIIITKADVS